MFLFLLIAYALAKHNYQNNKALHQTIAELALSLEIDSIIFVGENFYQSKMNSEKAIKYNLFEDLVNISDISKLQNTLLLIKIQEVWPWSRQLNFCKYKISEILNQKGFS